MSNEGNKSATNALARFVAYLQAVIAVAENISNCTVM